MIPDLHLQETFRDTKVHFDLRIGIFVGIGNNVSNDLRHAFLVDIDDNGWNLSQHGEIPVIKALHDVAKAPGILILTLYLELSQVIQRRRKEVAKQRCDLVGFATDPFRIRGEHVQFLWRKFHVIL